MEERAKKIIEACLNEHSKNPVDIFYHIAQRDFVRIHGPEHHILDGAAILTAFYNAGGEIDLQNSLVELMKRGLQMPIEYVNANYNVKLESSRIECSFSEKNEQCIKEKCPFYKKRKKKVAFICVHNSCRSQIAEALGKHLASDVFESYSAGTETKPQINQDAVRIMKELYGIDMEQTQYSKLISDIPIPDVAISMGCNVGCPFIGRAFDDNWGLEDPTGKSDEEFKIIIQEIENKILQLKRELSR